MFRRKTDFHAFIYEFYILIDRKISSVTLFIEDVAICNSSTNAPAKCQAVNYLNLNSVRIYTCLVDILRAHKQQYGGATTGTWLVKSANIKATVLS